jgi:hypothetical protein
VSLITSLCKYSASTGGRGSPIYSAASAAFGDFLHFFYFK